MVDGGARVRQRDVEGTNIFLSCNDRFIVNNEEMIYE